MRSRLLVLFTIANSIKILLVSNGKNQSFKASNATEGVGKAAQRSGSSLQATVLCTP
ncbi:hypothetical protein IQ259_08320 [Fortiea sp. LEGE XX443]|nr:hypothetical protein [Fortiea sp. LEGE XX443]